MSAGRLAAALALGLAAHSGAPAESVQPSEFRYRATQLDCARFVERSHGSLDAQTGTARRRETLTREAWWVLRARPAGDSVADLALEAWLDSLALVRAGPGGTLRPDTDGLLGGRYRGILASTGAYTAQARPFVPDEVAEVADMGRAMDDLLPPLPPRPLPVGQRWSDSAGLELQRLPDSTVGGAVIRRLALHTRRAVDRATVRGDSVEVPARETTVEDGQVSWDETLGLLRRERHITVITEVPAGGMIRQPLRSRLEQEVVLERRTSSCPAGAASP